MKNLCLSLIALACLPALAAGQVVEEIITRVNNQIITRSEFERSKDQLKEEVKQQNAADPDKAYADCTAPASARAPEGSVDMGTGYDCTDVMAHTAAKTINPAQRRWRNTLVSAMAKQGFVNYSKEWWHFSLPGASGPAYDFPIPARRS